MKYFHFVSVCTDIFFLGGGTSVSISREKIKHPPTDLRPYFFKKNLAIQLLPLPRALPNNPFQLTKRRLQRRERGGGEGDFNLPLFDMLLRRYFVGNWDVGAKKAMLIVSFEDGKASVGTETAAAAAAGQKGWSTSRGEKMEGGFIKLLRFIEETIFFVIANVFPSFSVHRSVQFFLFYLRFAP